MLAVQSARLPADPRNYVTVLPGPAGTLLLAEQPLVPVDQQPDTTLPVTLHKFDLGKRKTEQLMTEVGDFDLSRDGKMLLVKVHDAWSIAPVAAPGATQGLEDPTYRLQAMTIIGSLITHAQRMQYRIAVLDSGVQSRVR